MNIKETCDRWIDYAYKNWLDGWIKECVGSYLHDSIKNMVERMKEAAESPDRAEEAWNLLERLKRLSDGFYNLEDAKEQRYLYERAEVYMECALSAYKMGDLQEALNLLRVSNNDFPRRSPYKAIGYWFYGCIQWQLPSHFEAAILSWERTAQILTDFGVDKSASDITIKRKCDDYSAFVRRVINDATRNNLPSPPAAYATPEQTADSVKTPKADYSPYEAVLKLFPYYGSIPAGDPVAAMRYPAGRSGVDALEISGNTYKVFNFKREGEIFLNLGLEHFVLKVSGHSMNDAKPVRIEDGDYVLLAAKEAQNNDIVAAVMLGSGEPAATLKRYLVRDGRRILKFESSVEEREIPMSSTDYIQGVVVAILKPQ
jgi:tetratricopeptide (TPR) repeat protein